jgi:5'-nucleotidase
MTRGKEPMNFLLTNDDGIAAPGLWAAARALAGLGRVLIVAPSQNYSGYGAALPPADEFSFALRPSPRDLPFVTAFAVDGTPATCAHVGLSGALSAMPIDLVVSGVNAGLNVGRDVFLSGTVGAALTARILGYPAIAISMEVGNNGGEHWDTAGACLAELVQTFGETIRLDDAPYNVNVPNRPLHELAGVRVTTPSTHSCLDSYQLTVTAGERLQVQRVWQDRAPQHIPGTDTWAVANGYISLTRLRLLRDAGQETSLWRDTQLPQPMPVFTAGIGLNIAHSPNGA